jgi:hypothetical protein
MKLIDKSDFASDSLFCEYAYVVDLDNDTLELFRGFQEEPHDEGRFASAWKVTKEPRHQYYPVKLVKTIPFANLAAEFNEFCEEEQIRQDEENAAYEEKMANGGV